MYPIFFELGGFQVRSYGVIVGLSFLLALWMSTREAERKGVDPKLVQDFALYALLGGIVRHDFILSCFLSAARLSTRYVRHSEDDSEGVMQWIRK